MEIRSRAGPSRPPPPLETFLGGMEILSSLVPSEFLRLTLKPSLVEWKFDPPFCGGLGRQPP